MDVLKFKSAAGGVTTFRHYPIATIKKITHTKSEKSESLSISFIGGGTETLTDIRDIKKVLATIDTFVANKNQLIESDKKTKARLEAIKADTEKKKKARAAQIAKAKEARASAVAGSPLKKIPKKRSDERKAERRLSKSTSKKTTKKASKKAEKKTTKKATKKVTKKVTKKKSKKKSSKK